MQQPTDFHSERPPQAKQRRIFIVEDSPTIREHLVTAVSAISGCQVIGTAESEADAIQQVVTLKPDLVVTDIQLLRGSGLGVLRGIRASAPPQPTVVMFTHYGSSREYHRQALAAGADAVFDKTTQYSEFLDFVAQTVE